LTVIAVACQLSAETMGCQGSKAAKAGAPGAAPPQESPIRALTAGSEAAKVAGDGEKTASSASFEASTTAVAGKQTSSTLSYGNESARLSGGTASGNAQSHVTLRRQATICTERHELDTMVVEFSSHDSTVGSAIGRNCKEMQWKVMFDLDAAPIHIKLHVQEHKLHSNEVSIECNGQDIFHGAGPHAKTKMIEDFRYEWPFRATIRGISEINVYMRMRTKFGNYNALFFTFVRD